MTDRLLQDTGVELHRAARLRLVQAPAPALPPGERLAMDRVWEEAVRANPRLFDGPVAACAGLASDEAGGLVVTWVRTTYRHYALRRVPGTTVWLPSLFTGVVQPTEDGRLLVGRMAEWTVAAGRWGIPAGTAEPPEAGAVLDESALRRHAVRELWEETGVEVPPGALTLWRVTRGGNGSVGVLFLAPPLPASLIRERHAALVAAEAARGDAPELDRIALVRSPGEVHALPGPQVDFLEHVVRAHAARSSAAERCEEGAPPPHS